MPNHHNLTQFLLTPIKKVSLILTFCLLWTSIVVGQSFLPFPRDGAMWQIESNEGDSYGNGACIKVYGITGDTIISGLRFYHIEMLNFNPCPLNDGIYGCGNKDAEFIAQDSTGKLFIFWNGNIHPWFDYQAGLGDTLEIGFGNFMVVDSLDTVQYGGIPRRRWFVRHLSGIIDGAFIEGIGTTAGISNWDELHPDGASNLSCYSEFGTSLYQNPVSCAFGLDCEQVADINEPSQQHLRCFPNPVHDQLHIQSDIALHSAAIYDLQGRLLIEKHLDGFEGSLNVESLPAGCYICLIPGMENQLILKQ